MLTAEHKADPVRQSGGAKKNLLSELTSAVAMGRCDDKRVTRRILTEAGLSVPAGRTATGGDADAAFLAEAGRVVVKPARGEQGNGITVGVRTPEALTAAVTLARQFCPDVLIEQMRDGEDLRVIVIDHEVVAVQVYAGDDGASGRRLRGRGDERRLADHLPHLEPQRERGLAGGHG